MPNLMKQWMLGEFTELFKEHENFVLVNYAGLNNEETLALRNTVREKQLKMKVIRNRIARRAWQELGYEGLDGLVGGQTAVIVGTAMETSDPVSLTKAATELSKGQEKLEIKGGFADGTALDKGGVEAMSKAPSREELYAKIAGILQQPAIRVIRCVRGPVEKFAKLIRNAGDKFNEEGQG